MKRTDPIHVAVAETSVQVVRVGGLISVFEAIARYSGSACGNYFDGRAA